MPEKNYTGIPEEVNYDNLSQDEWNQFVQDHVDTFQEMYGEYAFGDHFDRLSSIYLNNAFLLTNTESGKRFKQDVQKALEDKFNEQN